ncbi:MAG TPA: ATP-binding protein [Bacteroidales bacterium]|nr:ATP-binding protein [Bacteroidales bacterium]
MQKTIRIESAIENLRVVENAIDTLTNDAGISQDCYGKILIGTLEAVNNAIVHGNKSDVKKVVQVEFNLVSQNLMITVTDEGSGFKPEEIPDPTLPENIEALAGRGVFLMSKLADDIKFNNTGNSVTMIFKISGG